MQNLDRTTEARVRAGIALMDAMKPGWREMINPITLDLRSEFNCILGQCFGSYHTGLARMPLEAAIMPHHYGFNLGLTSLGVPEAWHALNQAWLRELL